MPIEVILPKVDMDMTHGTLVAWHVAEGDTVAQGAALFDIETDKAAMEVEAPATGRLGAITARPGERVAVGTVVALIYATGEVMAPAAEPTPAPTAPTPSAAAIAPVRPAAPEPSACAVAAPGALRATPAARAAARQWGLHLQGIPGSGPLGRIQLGDVLARVQTPAAPDTWAPQPGPLHRSHRPGQGAPLLLIHGFAADAQAWAPLERALGPARALIRIDLPGHGRSPRRRLRGFADLARLLVEAFDEAAPDAGPVHLLGHSRGAALALAIADIRPRRVASLGLIAPAGLGPEIDAASLTGIARATRVESLAPWLRRLTATPQGISDDYARAAMRLRTDPALRAAQTDMAEALFPDGVQAFDLRPALARLQTPTCLIWGRQDRIVPPAQAIAAEGDFALHLLSGAGHVPQIECPDRVARIVLRHLAAAEATP